MSGHSHADPARHGHFLRCSRAGLLVGSLVLMYRLASFRARQRSATAMNIPFAQAPAWTRMTSQGRAPEVEVRDGVQRLAAHHAGGRIAEAVGHPGLRAVVQGDGQKHDHQLKDDGRQGHRHGA